MKCGVAIKKVTKRWLLNSFAVILLLIIIIEGVAAFAIYRYYHNEVRQTLYARADVIGTVFEGYYQNGTSADAYTAVRDYVASFSDKARMELMVIDADGNIALTSSGFEPDDKSLPEYQQALADGTKIGEAIYDLGNAGTVMAISLVAPVEGEAAVSAVRLVTALTPARQRIAMLIFAAIVLGVGVLCLILFSSSYFIGSIVRPVGEIGETARKIAQGDFDARLERKTDDEIGELCDMVNYMAEELAAAERIKNDFISSVSHELRTPLTAIRGWAETILQDAGEDKQTLEKGMGVIIGETSRLSAMVEELLDFSHMQSGRLKLIRSRIDVIAELSEAVLMYTQRADREGIALLYEDGDQIAPVNGDANKLRQVFINVIDNAIKYSNSGGTVHVEVAVGAGQVEIAVQDAGIGIKSKDLPQIKTKFYKADFSRRGSGIGLAVADEIVTRHGGMLDIQSVYGEGTTVKIFLPIYTKQGELAQVDDAPKQNGE